MNFLQDYLLYNSGNECPLNYHRWCGIFLLNATLGKRVYCTQGIDDAYYEIHPNLYIGLVGRQGSRKSTAKDIARDLFLEANPDSPIAASVQSCQDIVKRMSTDEVERAFTNEEGILVSYKPYTLFVNELKNFLSINPTQMLDFLTDIYDRKHFDSSTIKHGLQQIENPCLNLLACETPKWIIEKLRSNIITGGFSRRIIYVYEIERSQRIAFPNVTQEMKDARKRCIAHLQKLKSVAGKIKWTPEARTFYRNWYENLKSPDDEVMEGYYESKHIQLLKVAIAVVCAEPVIKLEFTPECFELGIAFLDSIEKNMPKLSIAAGRNELAIPQQNLLEVLEKNGGFLTQKEFSRYANKDLGGMEYLQVKRFLSETDQIVEHQGNIYSPARWLKEQQRKPKT